MDEVRKRELLREALEELARECREHGSWQPEGLGRLLAASVVCDDGLVQETADGTNLGESYLSGAKPSTCEKPATEELWLAFRSLVNVRPPWPASARFLAAQDELLRGMIAEAGVHDVSEAEASPLDARLSVWRGDITTLAADAIVNAANSQMTGCWAPLHYCIDNAIHTFAGVQLRAECAEIMRIQGHEEPTGCAKVTRAWNLPARFVAHTVGPIANGHPTDEHRLQLAASYRSCLDAAAESGARSLAFCCISTGVFGFPADEAARIAVRTVREWLGERDERLGAWGDANAEQGTRAAKRAGADAGGSRDASGGKRAGADGSRDASGAERAGADGSRDARVLANAGASIRAAEGSAVQQVIFNVFSEADEMRYRKLLGLSAS